MSKLAEIKKHLANNPDLVIVQTRDNNYLPGKKNGWSHEVELFISPKNGLYSADELQEFLTSLIPNIETNDEVKFNQGEHILTFGRLYFLEEVGNKTVHADITLTEEAALTCPDFVDGKISFDLNEKLYRSICIRLFPNLKVAKIAITGSVKSQIQISNTDLKRSKSLLRRMLEKIN